MEEKKEGRRKSAKEVDYNLMLLRAQKLQEGAECRLPEWGLLELGWAGAGRRWGVQACCTFRGGAVRMRPDQDATGGMWRHDLQPTGQPAQPHRASACLTRETSKLWDPEQCGERGWPAPLPGSAHPTKGSWEGRAQKGKGARSKLVLSRTKAPWQGTYHRPNTFAKGCQGWKREGTGAGAGYPLWMK